MTFPQITEFTQLGEQNEDEDEKIANDLALTWLFENLIVDADGKRFENTTSEFLEMCPMEVLFEFYFKMKQKADERDLGNDLEETNQSS